MAERELKSAGLAATIVVDCSHGNSNKDADLQPLVAENCVTQIVDGNRSIVGLMLESHLKAGSQAIPKDLSKLEYGMSITDPCIDWPTTESLLLKMHGRSKARAGALECRAAVRSRVAQSSSSNTTRGIRIWRPHAPRRAVSIDQQRAIGLPQMIEIGGGVAVGDHRRAGILLAQATPGSGVFPRRGGWAFSGGRRGGRLAIQSRCRRCARSPAAGRCAERRDPDLPTATRDGRPRRDVPRQRQGDRTKRCLGFELCDKLLRPSVEHRARSPRITMRMTRSLSAPRSRSCQ